VAYYKDIEEVPNTGGEVYIHRLESSKRGGWYVRIKRHNANGYFRKSLRTKDRHEAYKRANRYWITLREAEEQDLVLAPQNNFASLARKWLAHRKHVNQKTATRVIGYQFTNYYLPYFGNWNVGNITERSYIKYLNTHRLIQAKCPTMRKAPTLRTLDVEQQNLMAFLNWCFAEGKMRVRVDMRRVSKNELWIDDASLIDTDKPQRRDLATTEVYDAFRRYLRTVPRLRTRHGKPFDTKEPKNNLLSRRRLHFYMLSVYNFVCRAGEEVLNLKFKDLTAQESDVREGSYFVTMRTVHGKKVNRRKLSGPKVLIYHSDYNYFGYLKEWIDFLQEQGLPTGPDDWVFPVRKRAATSKYHNNLESYDQYEGDYKPYDSQSACRHLRDVKRPLKEWCRTKRKGGLTGPLEAQIDMFSMYSVRHIAIKNLIVESDYDFSRVAERANTGLSMIQDFYYKYGQDPEKRGLVTRHPTRSVRSMERYGEDDIEAVSSVIQVVQQNERGRQK